MVKYEKQSINFFKGCSLCYCDAIYRRVLLFVCSMNHVPPYLFLSREDDDDLRDIKKHYFRSVLLHLMLSNASLLGGTDCWCLQFITFSTLALVFFLQSPSFSFFIVGFHRCSSLTAFVHPYGSNNI